MVDFFCSMIRQGKMTLDDVKDKYPKWYDGVKCSGLKCIVEKEA
jgi:hypothetical protein